jgi:hypothetical protein
MAFTTGKNKQGSYREYSLENKGIEILVPLLFTTGNSFPGKYSHRENSPGNRSRERSLILLLQAQEGMKPKGEGDSGDENGCVETGEEGELRKIALGVRKGGEGKKPEAVGRHTK